MINSRKENIFTINDSAFDYSDCVIDFDRNIVIDSSSSLRWRVDCPVVVEKATPSVDLFAREVGIAYPNKKVIASALMFGFTMVCLGAPFFGMSSIFPLIGMTIAKALSDELKLSEQKAKMLLNLMLVVTPVILSLVVGFSTDLKDLYHYRYGMTLTESIGCRLQNTVIAFGLYSLPALLMRDEAIPKLKAD